MSPATTTTTTANRTKRPPPLTLACDGLPSPAPSAPPSAHPRNIKNIKSLSLSIPPSPLLPTHSHTALRRPSVVSLPGATLTSGAQPSSTTSSTAAAAFLRKTEDASPSVPYLDGPVQILPNVWIGSDDNARDWKCLTERGIKYILNVAKELACPFDTLHPTPLRTAHSTSDLSASASSRHLHSHPVYFHAHLPSGRPAFNYLKLPWSHGQLDLVKQGFPAAMNFVDQALAKNQGILIHCQCGVSRSATLVIALVMRAAANAESDTPAEILALKGGGMHAAYAFVKEKSKWVGPNMSLIYQLLDYERALQSGNASPASSTHSLRATTEDAVPWRAQDAPTIDVSMAPDDRAITSSPELAENDAFVAYEAKALDEEMEERNVARKASESSLSSLAAPQGALWKSRFGFSSVGPGRRTRTGSTSSNFTSRSSALSENVLEEDESEQFVQTVKYPDDRQGSKRNRLSPSTTATDDEIHAWSPNPKTQTFDLSRKDGSPRQSATRRAMSLSSMATSLHIGSMSNSPPSERTTLPIPSNSARLPLPVFPNGSGRISKPKLKHVRPSHLVEVLPPVPSSPIPTSSSMPDSLVQAEAASISDGASQILSWDDRLDGSTRSTLSTPPSAYVVPYSRSLDSRKPPPPPLRLSRHRTRDSFSSTASSIRSTISTPSQTLFVFPPSPTGTSTTMMVTAGDSEAMNNGDFADNASLQNAGFPTLSPTPRVSKIRTSQGRTKSFISLRIPPTPTTAFSVVEVRGMLDHPTPIARTSPSAGACGL